MENNYNPNFDIRIKKLYRYIIKNYKQPVEDETEFKIGISDTWNYKNIDNTIFTIDAGRQPIDKVSFCINNLYAKGYFRSMSFCFIIPVFNKKGYKKNRIGSLYKGGSRNVMLRLHKYMIGDSDNTIKTLFCTRIITHLERFKREFNTGLSLQEICEYYSYNGTVDVFDALDYLSYLQQNGVIEQKEDNKYYFLE